ncbi:MAG: DNA cytosine methyltransferase [Acidobacteriaceae bacterium]
MAADGASAFSGNSWMSWLRLSDWPTPRRFHVRNDLSVVDLFSGCGGMTLGAWEASRHMGGRLNVRLAIDFSAQAIAVYRHNFELNSDIAICDDVANVIDGVPGSYVSDGLRRIAKRIGEVDVLLAGPPCQGHSNLNNHSRRNDPRNSLYMAAIRGVEVFAPKFVLIENVPAVVHDEGDVITKASDYLRLLGYRVASTVVEVSTFGVAQRRRRHVTLASRYLTTGELLSLVEPQRLGVPVVRDAIGDLQDEADVRLGAFYGLTRLSRKNIERIRWLFERGAYDLPDSLRPACHRDKMHSYRSMYGRMRWDLPAQTLTTGFGSMGQGRYVHPARQRMLTCHEAARIQGFPDFFSFSCCTSVTALREMIGNAVPPQFVASVVKGGLGMSWT